MAQVELQAGPFRVVSLMSREAADELGLEPGVLATASVKATNVVVELPGGRTMSRTVPVASAGACAAAARRLRVPRPRRTDRERPSSLSGTVTVFAAASLTDCLRRDRRRVQRPSTPASTVVFNFGGSSALAQQIVEGAPADVFAAASPATMKTVTDAGRWRRTRRLRDQHARDRGPARRTPAGSTGLADFANPELAHRPVRRRGAVRRGAAEGLRRRAGHRPSIDTYEQDVKAVLTKVELGEVGRGPRLRHRRARRGRRGGGHRIRRGGIRASTSTRSSR